MSKILVTGGCGFIGSHLVDRLSKSSKNKIIVVDNLYSGNLKNLTKRKNISFKKLDISNYNSKLLNSFNGIDIVFHIAGVADIVPSINHPEFYYRNNVTGTLNIMQCCVKKKVKKVVYAASASCYGIPVDYPTKENSEIKLNFPYALTKKLGEDVVLHWGKVYGINTTSLRLFNVYGLRSRTSGAYGAAFGVFLAQKLKNKPLTIVGDGTQTRDFIHVYDVANAFIAASKFKKNGYIFNVGSGKEISVNYMAQKISKKKIFIPKRPGEPDRSCADIRKIKRLLLWRPRVSIEEGIRELLKNIDMWKKAPVWTKSSIKKATRVWFKYLK